MKRFSDFFLIFVLISSTVLFYSASSSNDRINDSLILKKYISEFPDSIFRSGDLIFRDGRGFFSVAFKKLSLKDPRYSHVGIIHKENDKTFVYHLIGGEGNLMNGIRKESLEQFCSLSQTNTFGVFRTDQDANQIDSLAGKYFSEKLKFDTEFNLSTDDKMYCTEFVYKILKKVSGQENFLPLTTLSGITYESCDNIYLSSHSKEIYSFTYPN